MSTTVTKTISTMLWPDGKLDVPEEIREQLGLTGGWQCRIEVVDGALVVRPVTDIPDEDLWAYEPETHTRLLAAQEEPAGSGFPLSPQDIRDIAEGRLSLDDIHARS